jgi:hypothetical protein
MSREFSLNGCAIFSVGQMRSVSRNFLRSLQAIIFTLSPMWHRVFTTTPSRLKMMHYLISDIQYEIVILLIMENELCLRDSYVVECYLVLVRLT